MSQLLNLLKLKKSNKMNISVRIGGGGSIDKDITHLHLHLCYELSQWFLHTMWHFKTQIQHQVWPKLLMKLQWWILRSCDRSESNRFKFKSPSKKGENSLVEKKVQWLNGIPSKQQTYKEMNFQGITPRVHRLPQRILPQFGYGLGPASLPVCSQHK